MRAFFSTPARQAGGWAVLGILGVLLFGAGAWLLLGGDDSTSSASHDRATATASVQPSATATPRPSATASASAAASASATGSPSATATATTAPNQNQGNQNNNPPPPTSTPTATPEPPTPTPSPTPVPRVYCPSSSQLPTQVRVHGALTIGGVAAPIGTSVTILLDGVPAVGRPVSPPPDEPGTYHVDVPVALSDSCLNRAGAAVSVLVNGQVFATGRVLPSPDSAGILIGLNISIN